MDGFRRAGAPQGIKALGADCLPFPEDDAPEKGREGIGQHMEVADGAPVILGPFTALDGMPGVESHAERGVGEDPGQRQQKEPAPRPQAPYRPEQGHREEKIDDRDAVQGTR